MDYRSLLTIPLAALALSASGAETLRQPSGWFAGASYAWPQGATHEAGVAPETENSGQRALTIRAIGKREVYEVGSISQSVVGYAGRRVRFSAQVKTAGVDQWAGLAVGPDFLPLFLRPTSQDADTDGLAARGAPGCPEWCDVSVVADIPAETGGMAQVGLALVGSGQVWARGFKLETVGREVPVTEQRFGVEATAAFKALAQQNEARMRMSPPATPQNLALQ